MATREQIEANRRNSRLSTGPRDTSLTRFNGLKHGLCAAQVGLPGEDPAEVQAEFDGWHNDWRPMTHTRAVLVDLAAVATWRLRRSIRAGSAVRARLADDAGRAFDAERLAAVERAIDRFDDDPGAALSLLGSTALGIDRLLTSWGELDASLEDGPAGWDQRFHLRLMILLGHPHGTPLFTAGAVPIASARLLAARKPGAKPLPKGEAEETVAALRRTAAEAMAAAPRARRDAPRPGPGPSPGHGGGHGRHVARASAGASLRDGPRAVAPRGAAAAHGAGEVRRRPPRGARSRARGGAGGGRRGVGRGGLARKNHCK